MIRETIARGLVPCFGVFDLGDTRILSAFAAAGLVRRPVLLQINFFCDLMTGPTPSIEALDSILAEWRRRDVDAEIFLFVRAMPDRESYEALFSCCDRPRQCIHVSVWVTIRTSSNGTPTWSSTRSKW